MNASVCKQLHNLEREQQRDLAAEMAAPMVEYATRVLDRMIAQVEADRARLPDSVGEARDA